jgi:hypothetical protein
VRRVEEKWPHPSSRVSSKSKADSHCLRVAFRTPTTAGQDKYGRIDSVSRFEAVHHRFREKVAVSRPSTDLQSLSFRLRSRHGLGRIATTCFQALWLPTGAPLVLAHAAPLPAPNCLLSERLLWAQPLNAAMSERVKRDRLLCESFILIADIDKNSSSITSTSDRRHWSSRPD